MYLYFGLSDNVFLRHIEDDSHKNNPNGNAKNNKNDRSYEC